MKYGWLAILKRPIDGGKLWRGRPIFGASKTWRGPITVALGAAAVLELQARVLHHIPWLGSIELFDYGSVHAVLLGAAVGGLAELAELPNSLVKRRLGVPPGGTARGLMSAIFYVWDQVDLLLGFWLAYATVLEPTLVRVGVTLAVALALHPLLTLAGFWVGVRPTAR
jgi:CDP-2,3-bis-(O-geranylgeranyl)-sn-glycerol synthase